MEIVGYLASILIGVSLGLIGSGGSILTVPVLVYLFQVNPILATTYSLCIVGLSSIAGVISRMKQRLVDIKTIINFGIPSVIGVFLARKFFLPNIPDTIHLANTLLSKSNFIMLFFASLMLVGLGEGMLTGIVGAGGGFLIIPALVILGKLPMKKAIASSIFIISIKSIVGFIGDISHTSIDWNFLIVIVLLATLGIIIGNYLNKKMDGEKLKKGFGWFVLAMASVIFIEQFFFGK